MLVACFTFSARHPRMLRSRIYKSYRDDPGVALKAVASPLVIPECLYQESRCCSIKAVKSWIPAQKHYRNDKIGNPGVSLDLVIKAGFRLKALPERRSKGLVLL